MKKQYVLTQEEFSQLETIKDVLLDKMFDYDDDDLRKAENALSCIIYGNFNQASDGFDYEVSK